MTGADGREEKPAIVPVEQRKRGSNNARSQQTPAFCRRNKSRSRSESWTRLLLGSLDGGLGDLL